MRTKDTNECQKRSIDAVLVTLAQRARMQVCWWFATCVFDVVFVRFIYIADSVALGLIQIEPYNHELIYGFQILNMFQVRFPHSMHVLS